MIPINKPGFRIQLKLLSDNLGQLLFFQGVALALLSCQNQTIVCLGTWNEHLDRSTTVDLVRFWGPTQRNNSPLGEFTELDGPSLEEYTRVNTHLQILRAIHGAS